MKTRIAAVGFLMVLSAGLVSLGNAGCSPTLLQNLTAALDGSVVVVFVNDTPYRASFSYGTFNDLERDPPGGMDFRQDRLAAGLTGERISLQCGHTLAIGTEKLLRRVIDTNIDQSGPFDKEAFSLTVNFSDAPTDSDLAAVATVGTAAGVMKLAGVDFSCGDELVFTFREDPDAAGGFRIDLQIIHDEQ